MPTRRTPQPPGSTTARGYGYPHMRLRARWAPHVAAGTVNCARCHQPIHPGTPWDLGHNDNNRTTYSGPEHRRCNRQAAAYKAHKQQHANTPHQQPQHTGTRWAPRW